MHHWTERRQTDASRLPTLQHSKLQKMAIACAGYGVVGAGHHRISFDVVKLAIGNLQIRTVIISTDAGGSGT